MHGTYIEITALHNFTIKHVPIVYPTNTYPDPHNGQRITHSNDSRKTKVPVTDFQRTINESDDEILRPCNSVNIVTALRTGQLRDRGWAWARNLSTQRFPDW